MDDMAEPQKQNGPHMSIKMARVVGAIFLSALAWFFLKEEPLFHFFWTGTFPAAKVASAQGANVKPEAPPCKIEITQFRILHNDRDDSHVRLVGEITNHCPEAIGVQLRATARDVNGQVVNSESFWPASIHNIEPEKPWAFAMWFRVKEPGATEPGTDVTVEIIDRTKWTPRN
jgi:hypothetical protein